MGNLYLLNVFAYLQCATNYLWLEVLSINQESKKVSCLQNATIKFDKCLGPDISGQTNQSFFIAPHGSNSQLGFSTAHAPCVP